MKTSTKKDAQPLKNEAFSLNELAKLTATEYLRLRRTNEISTEDYVRACIEQIEKYEPQLHAWAYFDSERLLNLARKADMVKSLPENQGSGFDGRLWGVPVGVKDTFNTEDMPTQHGSAHFKSYRPGNDARVVTSLRREGALMAGKTDTAEFAVHTPGTAKNPHELSRTPGTSSSGSVVAVATGMVPVALATQTAGSTIRPASFCGVYGFKPSFSALPRTAMLKTTDTLDTVGMIARSVDDIGLMFDVMRVKDENYPIIYKEYRKPERLHIGDRPWRVGIVKGPATKNRHASLEGQIENFLKQLTDAGCVLVEFELPKATSEAHANHGRIYNKSLSYYFKREWGMDQTLFSPKMTEMIMAGLEMSYEQYDESLKFQQQLATDIDQKIAATCDILFDLSANDEAPYENDMSILPDHNPIYTMCYVPTLNMPMFHGAHGLPIGAQFIARRFDDYKLLYFAKFVEELYAKSRLI